MSIATDTTPTRAPTTAPVVGHDRSGSPSRRLETVRGDVRVVGRLLAELDPADPHWQVVGPMTASVSALVRRALGRDVPTGSFRDVAPVVHQRDLAVASRGLLRSDVDIVDTAAVIEIRSLCSRIAMALA